MIKTFAGRDALNQQHSVLLVAKACKSYARSVGKVYRPSIPRKDTNSGAGPQFVG